MDKFIIMRTWRSAPESGRSIGRLIHTSCDSSRVHLPHSIFIPFLPGLAWPGLAWPDLGNEDIDSDTSANILSRFSLAMNVTLSASDGFRSNDHWTRYTHYKKCNPHEGLMENKRGSFMNQASWRPWCSGSVCGFVVFG